MERPRRRRWRALTLRLLAAGVLLLFASRWLSAPPWKEIGLRLTTADPVWIWVAVVFMLARFVTWDQRWRMALAMIGALPRRRRSFFALQAAVLVNHVTPAARVLGGLLRARYVTRRVDAPYGRVYGVVLFDVVAHQVMTAMVTGLALVAMGWLSGHRALAGLAAVAMVALAAVGSYLAARPGGRTERLGEWIAKRAEERSSRFGPLLTEGGEAVRVLGTLLRKRRLRRGAVILGLGLFLFQGLAQAAVFHSLGERVSFLAVLVAVALGNVAGGLSGVPGGLGVHEAGMIVSFVLLGVSEVDAVAGTILFRGLHYGLVFGLGAPAIIGFELFDPTRRSEGAA